MDGSDRTGSMPVTPNSRTEADSTRSEELDGLLAFRPGQIVAGRFRIVRFIARGGMGEVYEADDLELREQVALKTISPGRLSDPRAEDRFRSEVQLARKITHPNVCRTFDVFKAQDPRTGQALTFVTMELLRGGTLSEVLRQRGRIPVEEAEAIARQLGSALHAAHAAGVIHRDFKSRNIVLVPVGTSGPVRAVVTDFGVATNVLSTDTTGDLSSEATQVVGTPAYMAPELITGRQATTRTDVYAFGVVLYEMVCGVLPFVADTPLAAALKRVRENPVNPRIHVADLPDRWANVITRCLAREPRERFASIADAVLALTGEPVAAANPRRRRFQAITAAILITTLAGAGSYLVVRGRSGDVPATAAPSTRRTIALLGFRNLSGNPEKNYISTALSEGIGTELGLGGTLRTVPGESVERMKIELGLSPSETLAADTLRRVRLNLATDLVVVGSYVAQRGEADGQISIFLRVQDAQTGELVTSLSRPGTERNLGDLIAAAGAALRADLGDDSATPAGVSASRAALPAEADARRLYVEGLDALRRFDARRARDLLEKAVALQPDFPLAHSALSAAWADLGYDAQAAREAASALQLAERLPPAERQWIEGLYREATRDWERAAEVYASLVSQDPDNLEYGLRLAAVQVSAGRPADARRTAERLRARGTASDPRILLMEATAAGAAGDYRGQQQFANAAVATARRLGAGLLVARALIDESGALIRLDKRKDAEAASEEARRLYQEAGDRRGVARALIQLGNVYRRDQKMAVAEKSLREAVEIGRDLGNRSHTARALNDLANVYFDQRNFELAAQMYDDVLKIAREVGDRYTEARALNNLASARYELGDSATARRLDERALAIQRELGNPARIAFSLLNMAETALETGNLQPAQQMYEEALGINRDLHDRSEEAYALAGVARVLAYRGKASQAHDASRAALVIWRELGDKTSLAESTVTAAAVAGESGDRKVAIELLHDALVAGSELEQTTRILAGALLTDYLLTDDRLNEAELAYKEHVARGDLAALPQPSRILASIVEGRLRVARGEHQAGAEMLQEAASRARKLELRPSELKARLEYARVQSVRSPAAARRELTSLAREARVHGFVTLAGDAERILERLPR